MILAGAVWLFVTSAAVTGASPKHNAVPEIEPGIVRQDASGTTMTSVDITAEYAAKIQSFIIENFKKTKAFGLLTLEPGDVSVVGVNGQPVAIIRLRVDGEDTIVSIVGMQASDLVRITCAVDHGRADYHAPLCARAVQQNLGITLP
jgi:hypothetical protein